MLFFFVVDHGSSFLGMRTLEKVMVYVGRKEIMVRPEGKNICICHCLKYDVGMVTLMYIGVGISLSSVGMFVILQDAFPHQLVRSRLLASYPLVIQHKLTYLWEMAHAL